jgi:hypothetical protein
MVILSMASIERRAAARFMVRADAQHWNSSEYRDGLYRLVDRGIGGIGVFLGGLEETASMIEDLQRRGGRRLIIAGDYEFGLPMRLSGGVAYPRAMALGKTLPGITEHVAQCIANEARAIGVHWNWAPVADINANPNNPIVNTRSFGETSDVVAKHAVAYVQGTQRVGVLACAKHVPGHGDTHVDSHIDLPVIDLEQSVAEGREFVPFRACIDAGVRTLMMGHIVVPFLDPDLPSSLSRRVVTDLVRGAWGYTGLITTDALDMGAVRNRWTSGEAAILALKAGVDVVLMPEDPNAAIDAIMLAIEREELDASDLEASDARWEDARAFVGLRTAAGGTYSSKEQIVIDQSTHAMIALQAAEAAVHVTGDASLLPIMQHPHVAAFAILDESEADTATTWFQSLAQATEVNIDMGFVDGTIEEADLKSLIDGISEATILVFAFFGKAVAFKGKMPGFDRIPYVMEQLAQGRPSIVVACGSPYGIDALPSSLAMYTYSDTLPSIAASVMRLIGRSVHQN